MTTKRHIQQTKTVFNAVAQSTTVCEPWNVGTLSELSEQTTYNLLRGVNSRLAVIYLLQKRYALRVSETLLIKPKDITSKGSVVIRGLKGSNDKYIELTELRDFFIDCKKCNIEPFKNISRYYVYREYKKVGINNSEMYGNKTAVTHGFRYAKVREIQEIENDLELSKSVLGHKNINSTKHYER